MPADFSGYWKMVSNDNFEEYLKALDVNVAVRKIANLLKPDKEILQNGDHMIIKTLSTFRNYIMEFDVGKEFEEDLAGVDDRKCMTTVSWDGDKLLCVQNGEKEGRGWTQWIEGDEMHLLTGPERRCLFFSHIALYSILTVSSMWVKGSLPAEIIKSNLHFCSLFSTISIQQSKWMFSKYSNQ
ncbi:retinol-binding protein 1 isoform X3 [Haliaeetus albicilla]|uniref:retinol-binding protein 1 isoform X3 n=1 Tax=Haliaeetus albicilla TaxID=8969 RepID=UPI0037E75F3B